MAEAAGQLTSLTIAEFLRFQGEPDTRYELVGGRLVAMAPGSNAHGLITGNAWGEIDRRLEGRPPCRAQVEAGVLVDDETFLIADVAATCAEKDAGRYVESPVLLVEILSPTTVQHDLAYKLERYKELPTVTEIWLVDSRRRWVEVWSREAEGWVGRDVIGHAGFRSPLLAGEIALDRLYRHTTL